MGKVMNSLQKMVNNMHFYHSQDYNFKTRKWFFISGPMRGVENYRDKFNKCEETLYEISGHDPNIYNPAREGLTGSMMHPLRNLLSKREWGRGFYYVDAIILLPEWETSEGAVLEALVASQCGIDLVIWDED